MDAHQHRLLTGDIAADQSQIDLLAAEAAVRHDAEVAVLGRQGRLGDAQRGALAGQPVGDEIRHVNQRDPVSLGEALQLRLPGHGAVLVHDLADDSHRVQAGQPGQVDRGLGLAVALQDTAGAGTQREDVPGHHEIGRRGVRVGQLPDGDGAVEGRDAGRYPLARLDRDGEGRPEATPVRLRRHHERQSQPVSPLWRHRHADEPPGLARHEVDRLRRGMLRRDAQVSLVLPIPIVHDDHELPLPEVRDRPLDSLPARHRQLPVPNTPVARVLTHSRPGAAAPSSPRPAGPGREAAPRTWR
ncbi:hypothetical protein HRbin26_02317 [bacterium HR26]|nr:hypothetical protein HRbin26_02317 [bacterium HR26]